jgi:uncharacterized protein YigA (DUF484 family)
MAVKRGRVLPEKPAGTLPDRPDSTAPDAPSAVNLEGSNRILPDDVAAFLRANPGWLSAHPELYHLLEPPQRLHGEPLADHMAAMLAQARAEAESLSVRAETVLAAGRAAAGLSARVQEAVLALMRAADLVECVTAELPALLGVDAATLCAEQACPGLRPLPAGTVERLFGPREVVFREQPDETRMLHGSAAPLARVDALVRLAGGALLALAARDPAQLHPGQGARPLAFLGRAISAAQER